MKRNGTVLLLIAIALNSGAQDSLSKYTEIWTPVPAVVTPGKSPADAPSDAIILFKTKKDTTNWVHRNGKPFSWNTGDSSFTVAALSGELCTKQSFGDCQLHIEWRTPAEVKGEGQDRGNSGIFLMSRYELQVMDSYNNPTYSNGQAGSMYKQHMPMVNVCRPPGEWQDFDILFTAPQFYENGSVKSPARITVFQNGVLILNNVGLWGTVEHIGIAKYKKHAAREPISLQDHGNPVSYRNVWIREL